MKTGQFSVPCRFITKWLSVLALLIVTQAQLQSLHASFFQIDSISQPDNGSTLAVNLRTAEDTASLNTYIRGYLYDKSGKLTYTFSNPPANVPMAFIKGTLASVYFPLPPKFDLHSGTVVIVFGDAHQADSMSYPSKISISDLDYPEKEFVHASLGAGSHRKEAIPTFVEHTVNPGSQDPNHPQLTLFLRMPKGVDDPSQLQGLMVVCILWPGLDEARSDMRLPELGGDYGGLFSFANQHKFAIVAWGGPGSRWDSYKNYDEMDSLAFHNMDLGLNIVADTWEQGMQELINQYHLPKKDYLIWGICGSAQWAQRICLRKPQYFLANYLLIPGSFDKPTPGASKVLWCLCTGERYGGYENAIKWHKKCLAAGYPMLFKAYEGLGHDINNPASREMAFKFFEFALTQKSFRDQEDNDFRSGMAQLPIDASDKPQDPWIESFKHPPYYGDIVNQEVYPADQVEMIPESFRTPLPTKELADFWNTDQ